MYATMYRTMKQKNFKLSIPYEKDTEDYAMFGLFLTKKGVQSDTLELHYEFVADSGSGGAEPPADAAEVTTTTTIQASPDTSSAFIILILVASGMVTIGF
jgi:hypothetical protein